MLTGRILDVDEIVSIIDAITADEIKILAQELFIADQLRLAVVGSVAEDETLSEIMKLL